MEVEARKDCATADQYNTASLFSALKQYRILQGKKGPPSLGDEEV